MSVKENYKNNETFIKFIKRRYIITIILPIFCVVQFTVVNVLRIENQYPFFDQILVYITEGVLGLFVIYFFIALFKRKYKESFRLLVVPIIVVIFAFVLLDKSNINRDTIYYHLNKSKYLAVIQNSSSIATDGKGKLVQMPMKGTYIGCDKYLIYDETDEMANPKGNFRGINYVTVHNSVIGKIYKEKAYEIEANNVDNHVFIVYFCENTGQ